MGSGGQDRRPVRTNDPPRPTPTPSDEPSRRARHRRVPDFRSRRTGRGLRGDPPAQVGRGAKAPPCTPLPGPQRQPATGAEPGHGRTPGRPRPSSSPVRGRRERTRSACGSGYGAGGRCRPCTPRSSCQGRSRQTTPDLLQLFGEAPWGPARPSSQRLARLATPPDVRPRRPGSARRSPPVPARRPAHPAGPPRVQVSTSDRRRSGPAGVDQTCSYISMSADESRRRPDRHAWTPGRLDAWTPQRGLPRRFGPTWSCPPRGRRRSDWPPSGPTRP